MEPTVRDESKNPSRLERSELEETFRGVLMSQDRYSSSNTAEMSARGTLVRRDIPHELRRILAQLDEDETLRVEGSDGVGRKSRVPWVRIYDPVSSPSATTGLYLVYLFSEDGSFVRLSLMQGTTTIKGGSLVPRPVDDLTREGERLRGNLRAELSSEGDRPPGLNLERARDLGTGGLAHQYEAGDVCHLDYLGTDLPSETEFQSDLAFMIGLLHTASAEEPSSDVEDNLLTLSERTNWPISDLKEALYSLTDESRQIALCGPPGTGKTFVARELAASVLGIPGDIDNERIHIVQFHPNYGYEEFFEGLRPVPNSSTGFSFELVPGDIVSMVERTQEDDLSRVVIIDEANRANIPKVFGELMYLLEYRDTPIRTLHRDSFALPSNIYFILTMNTADRNIRSVDLALRRRFDFFDVMPSAEALRSFYSHDGNQNQLGESLILGFESLNARLRDDLDRHHQVGHSYFMKRIMSRAALERVWRRQVGPLIAEFFIDRPDIADSYSLTEFWADAHRPSA
jgi:MoxR-like ATPase